MTDSVWIVVLTSQGPKFILKEETRNCRRLHNKLYYDHSLVNVLLGLMLDNHGRSEAVFLQLHRHFVTQGSPCALLGTRNRDTRRRLMEDIWALQHVQSFRDKIISTNTANNEWKMLSHDCAFKSLFTILGQEKMAQKSDEKHALHSVLGMTGALPGLSPQGSEGTTCFNDAMTAILPLSARNGTEWLFTDTPGTVPGAIACLPNLVGIAEDPLRLVLRVETCFGETRTPLSRKLLCLQKKFTNPCNCAIYNGETADAGEEGREILQTYGSSPFS